MSAFGKKDYYGILDVPCDADADALKAAYRRLVKRYHPDRRPGDREAEERFKELQEAYEVLKDPARRGDYDALYLRQRARAGKGRQAAGTKSGVSEFVEDVFELIRSRMENRGRRGEDLRYLVSISLEEAACGVRRAIRIPKRKPCPVCGGHGWTVPADTPICQVCHGEGELSVPAGKTRATQPCPSCGGKGLYEKTTCPRCKGERSLVYRVQRTVDVPAGVDSGTRLRMKGEGGAGENGGENGDLYIVIQVKDHPVLQRRNLDVWAEIPLHFTQAALGTQVQVPTLQGETPVTVPPGTQAGEVLTLKGLGFPGLNGSPRGDQKIRIRVEVPRNLTEEEKNILRVWQQVRERG